MCSEAPDALDARRAGAHHRVQVAVQELRLRAMYLGRIPQVHELVRIVLEIEDPYGGPLEQYRHCYQGIADALSPIVP